MTVPVTPTLSNTVHTNHFTGLIKYHTGISSNTTTIYSVHSMQQSIPSHSMQQSITSHSMQQSITATNLCQSGNALSTVKQATIQKHCRIT